VPLSCVVTLTANAGATIAPVAASGASGSTLGLGAVVAGDDVEPPHAAMSAAIIERYARAGNRMMKSGGGYGS
jgi:hypothetical protein